jgi:hypothetical protein
MIMIKFERNCVLFEGSAEVEARVEHHTYNTAQYNQTTALRKMKLTPGCR